MTALPEALRDGRADPWFPLFGIARAGAIVIAVALLLLHRVTGLDQLLAVAGLLYGLLTIGMYRKWERLRANPVIWVVDGAGALALITLSGDWRSPFYLLGVTALIFPTVHFAPRAALAWAAAFTAAYLLVGVALGLDIESLRTTTRLESFVAHLTIPVLVALALSYASTLLRRLESERERSERLAVEAERQRIAWELHDSAKQRIHAAHLILTAVTARADSEIPREPLVQVLGELRHATADMETSLSDLRQPLMDGTRLGAALRERAVDFASAGSARIHVDGEAGSLPPFIAAHAYRVAAEALTNAVRHASARDISVTIEREPNRLSIAVRDDGCGIAADRRPGAHGLRSMHNRVDAMGGDLTIESSPDRGTDVRLDVPLTMDQPGETVS